MRITHLLHHRKQKQPKTKIISDQKYVQYLPFITGTIVLVAQYNNPLQEMFLHCWGQTINVTYYTRLRSPSFRVCGRCVRRKRAQNFVGHSNFCRWEIFGFAEEEKSPVTFCALVSDPFKDLKTFQHFIFRMYT